jgi:hypothetical protein
MCFDSRKRLDIADFDREEFLLLADSIGVLLDLRSLNDVQAQGTRDALGTLRQIKAAVTFPQVSKPQVFVAFSSRADREVVGIILDELEKLEDRLRILPWNHIDESGMISAQLAQAISSSKFGVCYLSEPNDHGGYQDNPNVLFEAGMLHARSLSTQDQTRWLPIREDKSPPAPFDFAGDRMEFVPRVAGRINDSLFRARLQVRLLRLTDPQA